MKPPRRLPPLTLLVGLGSLLSLAISAPTHAGVPRPAWVLYGQALDEYGWPCAPGTTLELHLGSPGTRLVTTRTVQGSIKPGVNYLFRIPLESGTGTPEVPGAAHPGEPFTIALVQPGRTPRVIESSTLPAVGQPGDALRLNLSAGTDTDGDGLPDEWEQWILDHSPLPLTLAELRPDGDFDGDGVSNADEYRAGTDPTWNRDYLRVDDWQHLGDGLFQLQFLSIPGKTYELLAAPLPTGDALPDWRSQPGARSPTGPPLPGPFDAAGYSVTLFIRDPGPLQLFRLSVR